MELSLPQKTRHKDLALVVLVSLLISSTTEAEKRELQTEFFKRLSEKFLERCHHSVNNLFRDAPDVTAIRDDIFQESFLTAMDKIQEFKMGSDWDERECEKVLLYWLGQIANNKIMKRRTEEKKKKEFLNEYEYFLKSENESGSISKRIYKPTYDKDKYAFIWGKLNLMSREIILFCAADNTLCQNNKKHLPDDKIAYLKEKYNVTSAAIRKAKQRALEALDNCKL